MIISEKKPAGEKYDLQGRISTPKQGHEVFRITSLGARRRLTQKIGGLGNGET
jgi:hypothetical protein